MSFSKSDEGLGIGKIKGCLYVLNRFHCKKIVAFLAEVWTFRINSNDIRLLALILKLVKSQLIFSKALSIDIDA